MKNMIGKLAVTGSFILAAGAFIPRAEATNVTLDGSGYYSLGTRDTYYQYGASQSGRYSNLGRDYYHTAEIGMDRITNRSSSRSGSMSFELWAMPYYGATSGTILMTKGVSSLWGGYNYADYISTGKAISLNRYRYPELNLFEYAYSGWKWRDALSFSYKNLL